MPTNSATLPRAKTRRELQAHITALEVENARLKKANDILLEERRVHDNEHHSDAPEEQESPKPDSETEVAALRKALEGLASVTERYLLDVAIQLVAGKIIPAKDLGRCRADAGDLKQALASARALLEAKP